METPNRKLYIALSIAKWLIFTGLLAGSLATIYQNFLVWQSGKLTTSSEFIHHEEDGLEFPSITFCNETGFKNKDMISNINWETFMENTLDLNEFFVKMEDTNGQPFNYTIKTTYSLYKGRCYTFEIEGLFKTQEPVIQLWVRRESNLKFLLHERGNEIWLYFEFWPLRPIWHKAGQFSGLIDVAVVKSELKEHCHNDLKDHYNQYQCLRNDFLLIHDMVGFNCTSPWMSNMKNLKSLEENKTSCNKSQFLKWIDFGNKYFKDVVRNQKSNCPSIFKV